MYSSHERQAASNLCQDMMSGVVSAVMGALMKAREAMMFPCISSSVSAVMVERRGGETQAGGPRCSE